MNNENSKDQPKKKFNIFEHVDNMKSRKDDPLISDKAITTRLFNKKSRTKGITLDVLLMKKDGPRSAKNGSSFKVELYIFNLDCNVHDNVGRIVDANNIILNAPHKIKLSDEDKLQGNFDSKQEWKYVDIGKEYHLKKNDTVTCNFYAVNNSDDLNQMISAKELSVIRISDLRAITLDSSSEKESIIEEKEVEKEVKNDETGEITKELKKEIITKEVPKKVTLLNFDGVRVIGSVNSVFDTLNPAIQRLSDIPSLDTKIPSESEIIDYLENNVIYGKNRVPLADQKKKKSRAINALFKKNCYDTEKDFYFGSYWIKLHPENEDEVSEKEEDKGTIHLGTKFEDLSSVKNDVKSMKANITLDIRQWDSSKGVKIDNPQTILLLVSTFGKQTWKFLCMRDVNKWEVLAPLHMPRIKCLIMTWPVLEDTSIINEIKSKEFDYAIKFGCNDVASDIMGYLVRDCGGFPVSADYAFEKFKLYNKDMIESKKSKKEIKEVAYFSEIYKNNDVEKNEVKTCIESLKSYHEGLLGTMDMFLDKIPKDDDDFTYYSLNNLLLNEEQKEIYKKLDFETRKEYMSDILINGLNSKYAEKLKLEEFPSSIIEQIYIINTRDHSKLFYSIYGDENTEEGTIEDVDMKESANNNNEEDVEYEENDNSGVSIDVNQNGNTDKNDNGDIEDIVLPKLPHKRSKSSKDKKRKKQKRQKTSN
jgi:hypothetical protein